MIDRQLDEEKIFHIARGIEAPDLREDYLVQICAGDQALRERVDALLDAHEKEQSLLKSNVVPAATEDFSSATEAVGEQIGRYKLLQTIGEGGFGVVYMAEQSRPVRRKVALKVIKPGMDTRTVVARFEAERQALALMDHANIAKVFDGGTTEAGRPYFVMELVKGIPITEFCDENKFTLNQRLELFTTVCHAIQHAHQKGIIHRDIKPSNVLVTLHDGVPIPKVIDFGVSKAISQQLTEKTLFTAHGQMIGTPQYMSPEQAEMSGLDIDTRSDIYSLGILLYELLTGCTPLDPARIRETAYVELQRMIREEEPQRPSRRYSTMGQQSIAIATHRQTDPQKLGGQLRGELDLIVMKSLEKDRNRRYDSATEFADDVQRFLSGDSVQACPPSASYRFKKFARKNRSLLVTGSLVAAILLVASISSSILAYRYYQIASEREQMLAQLQKARTYKQQVAIDRAVVEAALGNFEKARDAIAGAELEDPRGYEAMIDGHEASNAGKPPEALRHLEQAHQLEPEDIVIQAMLATAYLNNGDWESYAQTVVRPDERVMTDYERMFVGHAVSFSDPDKGLALLNEAAENLRHPLAYAYRAITVAFRAHAAQDRDEMESALDDARRSAEYLSSDSFDITWQLHIDILAVDLFRKLASKAEKDGDIEAARDMRSRADDVLHHADAIAAQIEEDELFGSHTAMMYHLAKGETEEAYKYATQGKSFVAVLAYALEDSNPEKIKDAYASLSAEGFRTEDRCNVCRYILLREQGKTAAEELVEEYLSVAVENGWAWVIDLALISGRWQEAEELATKLYARFPEDGNRFRAAYLRFNAGESTPEEYLAEVKQLGPTSGANTALGLHLLARGKRDEARKYFEASVAQGQLGNRFRLFSEVFLAQMEKDPNWPSWIPVEDENHSPEQPSR